MASPTSYKDPYWLKLADDASEKVGISQDILPALFLYGERSNNDQVSEAGARTVFQIIPATRKLLIDRYGIDPYLSDANAAEGAALLVKESSDRNKGDPYLIASEYHGGPNRKNWGPRTRAYAKRVVNGLGAAKVNVIDKDLEAWLAGAPTSVDEQIGQVQQIGTDIDGANAKRAATQETSTATASNNEPQEQGAPDVSNLLSDFDQWQATQKTPEPKQDLGLLGGIKEAITGEQRSTETSRTLPEWTGMPELNELSFAAAKTGLGTLLASPDEIVQVIKANYPNTAVRQDEKGNYVIKSSIDGADYVIPPGVTMGDIPRIIGGVAAFAPAGRAINTLGMTGAKGLAAQAATGGAAAAATQAAIEGTQAATGGNFSGQDVALTGLLGAALPPVVQGVEAIGNIVASPVKGALNRLTAAKEATPQPAAAPAAEQAARVGEEPVIMSGSPAPQTSTPAANSPMGNVASEVPLSSVAQTAVKAGEGGIGSKKATEALVDMVAPNPKTIAAADRLGMLPYLQADQVTTSQVFREISQAAKSAVGSKAREQELKSYVNLAQKADEIVTKLGGTDDLASVSQNIKKGLQETHDKLKNDASKIYGEIDDKLVKTATEAPAPRTLSFVDARAKTLGGKENLSIGEKKILKRLSPKENGTQPTYALLDQTRKEIGAAKRAAKTGAQSAFGSSDTKLLDDLENVLRADQGAVAEANGFGQKWESAQWLARTYKGLQNDLVTLFGKNIDNTIVGDLGRAVNALPKGDTSQFIKLVKSVPEDMRQELVASGLAHAFGKTAKQQTISFNSYARWYEGLLRNKQAHAALMSNLPKSARKSLSDLYRVSDGIAKASKERITTGRLNSADAAFKGGETLAAKLYETAKDSAMRAGVAAVAGAVHPGLGAAAATMLSKAPKTAAIEAADKVFSSPEFTQAVLQAANGNPKQAAQKLAKSKVFSDFVFKVGNPHELSNRERWILQAFEANQQQVNSR